MSEDRRRKTEDGRQKTDDRRQRTDDRRPCFAPGASQGKQKMDDPSSPAASSRQAHLRLWLRRGTQMAEGGRNIDSLTAGLNPRIGCQAVLASV